MCPNSSRQKLFCELGWESLEIRRNKHKLTLFYKILNGLTPGYNLKNENNTIHPRSASIYFKDISVIVRGKVFHSLMVKGIKLS
jgi:hypothetical protein